MPGSGSKQQVGTRGEDLACAELTRQGLTIVERNWRCSVGELDIVAVEGATLVFCEVKSRTGLGFGDPLEAITWAKRRTLRQLAAIWMRDHCVRTSSIRIDAIGVLLLPRQEPTIRHVKGIG